MDLQNLSLIESSRYIGQGPYADCQIVAMCNALRWHGLPSPEHPSKEWEELVDIGGARHGSVISTRELAEHLGLIMTSIGVQRAKGHTPVMLTVWNPEVGTSLHDILVISWCDEGATVVNYRGDAGPLVETLPLSNEDMPPRRERWTKLYLPKLGNVNRRAYLLTLTPALVRERRRKWFKARGHAS